MTSSQKKVMAFMRRYDTFGALFIETALEHYAKAVMDDGLSKWGDNSLISKDLWLGMAEDALEDIAQKRNVVS